MSMDEYIKKSDVLKLAYKSDYGWPHDEHPMIIEASDIEALPAADVAPVVRCKDCRFYEVKQSKLCDMHHTAMLEDDYCSYGVQKEKPHE